MAVTAGLLIAAGHGRRFDPTGRVSKLEQAIDGEWVAVRTARALAAGCGRVIAAVRPESTALARALAEVGCTVVPVAGIGELEGMGTSIGCAARAALALPDVDRVLVQPADMPWVAAATVRRLAAAEAAGCPIVVPVFAGVDGHPVRFDRSLLPALAALTGDRGARSLVLVHPAHRIAIDDPGVRRDLDTPADLLDTPADLPDTPATPGAPN